MSQRASKVAPLRLSEGFGWFEKGRFKMWFQCPVMTGKLGLLTQTKKG